MTAGTLTLISPAALGWSATVTGPDQQVVDTTTAQQAFTVTDATGSGAGWHITASATTFTNGTHLLPNTALDGAASCGCGSITDRLQRHLRLRAAD